MRKRAERTRKNERIVRLLSGLILGGAMLFQGTGFITSEARAADPTARNRDVTSFIDVTNLSDSSYNYGLYGSPLSQSVNIYDGVTAVIGKLTSESTSLNPASAVSMTMDSGSAFNIGLNQGGTSTLGTLIISGPWDTANASKLTANSGSSIHIGSKGALFVGYNSSSKSGTGTLTLNGGAALVNDGTGDYGVTVNEDGTLEFGESTSTIALTDFYTGEGALRNYGTIKVYNGITGSNTFAVTDYADYDEDLGTGSLTVAGNAALGASALKLYGTLKVSGNLDLASASSSASLMSASIVNAAKLVTVTKNDETGSSLTVNSKDATVGGLWVKRLGETGGSLTVATSADLTISGLENKFGTDGKQSASGLYDVNLGYDFSNSGTVTFEDEDGSGMIFTGASAYTGKTGTAGFVNNEGGTITSDSDLHLYGVDLNSGISGHSALEMSNKGTITVEGDLDINSASAVALTNTSKLTVGSMTIGKNLALTNGTAGTFKADTVSLNGGSISNAGTYSFTTMTLTSGSLDGTFTGVSNTASTTINSTVAVNGMIQLDGDTEFKKTSGTEIDPTVVTITGEGGFSGEHALTFTYTDVVNNGTLGTSALNAESITFNAGSSYTYTGTGTNIVNGDLIFDADAELTVSAANPLYLSAGKKLTVGEEGDRSLITFDLSDAGDSALISLLSEGDAAAAATVHSDIKLAESIANYVPGIKTFTLIKSSNADSVYDVGTISLEDGSSNNTLFVTREGRVSDDKTSYLLDVSTKGFSEFARTVNQQNVGKYIDSALKAQNMSDELGDFLSDVMNLDSDSDTQLVRRVMDTVSGANRANAMMLAMSEPWQYSFNQVGWETHRIYTPKCSSCGSTYRGQMEYDGMVYEDGVYYDDGYGMYGSVFGLGTSTPNTMWAAAHTTSFNARDDKNCGKYGITNTGISFGLDVIRQTGTNLGITFDYSQPYLYSSWEDANQHVDQTNFNLGIYGRRDYWNGISITGYIGGGLQNMLSKRDLMMSGIDQSLAITDTLGTGTRYESEYNGQSLAAALKLARDMQFSAWGVIRPLVQFDMQQVWMNSGEETGNAVALNYDKSDWNRMFVRAGFETEANTQFARFTSRFLYGCQLGGDTAPEMTASFAGDRSGNSMTLYGVDLGKNYFDAGLGAIGYLDCDYRWALSGNYDFTATEQSEAHTGTVALSYSF